MKESHNDAACLATSRSPSCRFRASVPPYHPPAACSVLFMSCPAFSPLIGGLRVLRHRVVPLVSHSQQSFRHPDSRLTTAPTTNRALLSRQICTVHVGLSQLYFLDFSGESGAACQTLGTGDVPRAGFNRVWRTSWYHVREAHHRIPNPRWRCI